MESENLATGLKTFSAGLDKFGGLPSLIGNFSFPTQLVEKFSAFNVTTSWESFFDFTGIALTPAGILGAWIGDTVYPLVTLAIIGFGVYGALIVAANLFSFLFTYKAAMAQALEIFFNSSAGLMSNTTLQLVDKFGGLLGAGASALGGVKTITFGGGEEEEGEGEDGGQYGFYDRSDKASKAAGFPTFDDVKNVAQLVYKSIDKYEKLN